MQHNTGILSKTQRWWNNSVNRVSVPVLKCSHVTNRYLFLFFFVSFLTASWPFSYLLALPREERKRSWNYNMSIWDTESCIRPVSTWKRWDESCSPRVAQSHGPYTTCLPTKQQRISGTCALCCYFPVWRSPSHASPKYTLWEDYTRWVRWQNTGNHDLLPGNLP